MQCEHCRLMLKSGTVKSVFWFSQSKVFQNFVFIFVVPAIAPFNIIYCLPWFSVGQSQV
jgi:hypothetical protein